MRKPHALRVGFYLGFYMCKCCSDLSDAVLDSVCAKFGIDRDNIGFSKVGGLYHWSGLVGDLFQVSNTGNNDLSAHDISVWLDDFEFRLNESGLTDINQAANELKKARGLL